MLYQNYGLLSYWALGCSIFHVVPESEPVMPTLWESAVNVGILGCVCMHVQCGWMHFWIYFLLDYFSLHLHVLSVHKTTTQDVVHCVHRRTILKVRIGNGIMQQLGNDCLPSLCKFVHFRVHIVWSPRVFFEQSITVICFASNNGQHLDKRGF